MQEITKHSVFKGLAVLIALTILVPSAVKLSHAFTHKHHKVEMCLDHKKASHLHEFHLDCEFYKFKLNNAFTLIKQNFLVPVIEDNHQVIISQYNFISDYQRLHVSLRGPPQYS